MIHALYPEALAPRIFRPERAAVSACRIKAHQILLEAFARFEDVITPADRPEAWRFDDPALERSFAQELWEALPSPSIPEDPARGFVMPVVIQRLITTYARGVAEPWPASAPGSHAADAVPLSIRDAITFAADPEGMLTAEQLAREFSARLRPLGERAPQRVLWRVVPYPELSASRTRTLAPFASLGRALRMDLGALGDPRRFAGIRDTAALYDLSVAARWQALRVSSATISEELARYAGLDPQTKFAELANPFEPLLGVWATGYAVEAVTDQAIFLLAPPL